MKTNFLRFSQNFLLMIFSIFITFSTFGDINFSFGINKHKKGHLHSKIQCPKCTYRYKKYEKYCPNCGIIYNTNSPLSADCKRCRRHFYFNEDTTIRICPTCSCKNQPKSSYCNKCGGRLYNQIFYIECPYCFKHFKVNYGSDYYNKHRHCNNCNKDYSFQYKTCPYCDEVYHNNHYRNHSSYHSRKDISFSTRKKPHPKVLLGKRIKIANFIKNNYNTDIKRFTISNFTSNRSFSKVIIENIKKESFTTIINMIKVYHQGRWIDFSQGVRLNNGINMFNISIPQNSTELLIAFDHGKGSEVSVYIE